MTNKTANGLWIIACAALTLAGCGQNPATPPPTTSTASETQHKHEGWWCDEHGVPEGVCTRCNLTLAADFKNKNDWCQEHDRPDSQCFICHPELERKFAELYEAKYGKAPPKPESEGQEKSEPKS